MWLGFFDRGNEVQLAIYYDNGDMLATVIKAQFEMYRGRVPGPTPTLAAADMAPATPVLCHRGRSTRLSWPPVVEKCPVLASKQYWRDTE